MTAPTQDARASLLALAQRLRAAAMEVLWRQWRAVGGQAAARGAARAAVDPEALVLLSLTLVEHESRLADILHDWTLLNSDLLAVQRAKNLAARYPEIVRARLAALARLATEEAKDLRWKSLIPAGASLDEIAPPGGVPVRRNKLRAVRVNADEPAALLLRLRLGFGVGARADLLGFLLATPHEWATMRELSAATTYTVAAVRRATEAMEGARLLHLSAGPPASYGADREAWTELLGLENGLPPWRNWHERFAFVAAFLDWAEAAQAKPLSPYVLGVKTRELLEQHRAAFERNLATAWDGRSLTVEGEAHASNAISAIADQLVESA